MTSMSALRRFALGARPTRFFHTSACAFIKVGDSIPKLDVLVENSPGNKVNLAEQTAKGKSLSMIFPEPPFSYSVCLCELQEQILLERATFWGKTCLSTDNNEPF
jgi:hypothetical protein